MKRVLSLLIAVVLVVSVMLVPIPASAANYDTPSGNAIFTEDFETFTQDNFDVNPANGGSSVNPFRRRWTSELGAGAYPIVRVTAENNYMQVRSAVYQAKFDHNIKAAYEFSADIRGVTGTNRGAVWVRTAGNENAAPTWAPFRMNCYEANADGDAADGYCGGAGVSYYAATANQLGVAIPYWQDGAPHAWHYEFTVDADFANNFVTVTAKDTGAKIRLYVNGVLVCMIEYGDLGTMGNGSGNYYKSATVMNAQGEVLKTFSEETNNHVAFTEYSRLVFSTRTKAFDIDNLVVKEYADALDLDSKTVANNFTQQGYVALADSQAEASAQGATYYAIKNKNKVEYTQGVTKITNTNGDGLSDPYIYTEAGSFPLSAEYKYAKIGYYAHSATTVNGAFYFSTDEKQWADTKTAYKMEAKDKWVDQIVEMNNEYWRGTINGIRWDYLDGKDAEAPAVGDYVMVRYIAFFKTIEAAELFEFTYTIPPRDPYIGLLDVDDTYTLNDSLSVNVFVGALRVADAWVGIYEENVTDYSDANTLAWLYTNGTTTATGNIPEDATQLHFTKDTFASFDSLKPGNYKAVLFGSRANAKFTVSASVSFTLAEGTVTPPATETPSEATAPFYYYNAYVEFNANKNAKEDLYLNDMMTTNMIYEVDEENSTVRFTITAPFDDPEAYPGWANFVLKGLALETAQFGAFVIRYKLDSDTTGSAMYWRGKNADGTDAANLGYTQGGDPYTYSWDNSGEWAYTIVDASGWDKLTKSEKMDLLRFDFLEGSLPGDVFELDYIAFFENVDQANAFPGSAEEKKLLKLNEEPPVTTPVDTPKTPATTPKTPETPPTGEYTVIVLATLAVVALGGFVVIKKKVRG